HFLGTIPGGMRDRVVQAKDIGTLEDGPELRVRENVRYGVDVGAQRADRSRERVEIALAGPGIDRIVDGGVREGGRESAGGEAFQRAGTRVATELDRFKQELRGVVEGLDIGACKSVSQTQSGEGQALDRIAREDSESCAVLRVILDEFRIDADRLIEG